jgi:serine/threonine protein phosphatase 1
MNLTVAVGDIHGMADKLERLLGKLDAWLAAAGADGPAQFVFLGDYVDRGPDSRSVVERVRAMQRDGAVCLRGNHEQLMIDATHSVLGERNFLRNGGEGTLRSFGSPAAFLEAQAWMTTLPTSHDDGLRHYVHAGVRPGIALERQEDQTRLWIREEFLYFQGPFPRYIVHGHTPTILTNPGQLTPEIRDNRCNVDTGAGAGAALSAAVFDDRQRRPIHTVSTM